MVEEDDESEESTRVEEAEMTLQALTGWDTPQTLRMLVALIHSGSTHNFISEKVANKLNLQI